MGIGLLRSALLFAVAAAALPAQTVQIGAPAPVPVLERTIPAGLAFNWQSLKGKPVVIEFWGTWCANCVSEIPHLNELIAQFDGIQFLSITDEPLSTVEPFLARHAIFGWVGLDRAGATFKAFGVEARPQTVLIDGEGIVRGVMHPAQLDAAVLSDLAAGRPVKPYRLPDRLGILRNPDRDPVFAVMLRPSGARRGGVFAVDPGKLQGESIALRTILAYAYSIGERRLRGPDDLLDTRYDFCVLLPDGAAGDTELLREMLERSFRLKLRREAREMDAAVLRLRGPTPPDSRGAQPIAVLVSLLESRLNRVVLNETGLDGRYKHFEFPQNTEDLAGALRAQMGIELSFERRPVEMLVVESMDLPAFRVNLAGR